MKHHYEKTRATDDDGLLQDPVYPHRIVLSAEFLIRVICERSQANFRYFHCYSVVSRLSINVNKPKLLKSDYRYGYKMRK